MEPYKVILVIVSFIFYVTCDITSLENDEVIDSFLTDDTKLVETKDRSDIKDDINPKEYEYFKSDWQSVKDERYQPIRKIEYTEDDIRKLDKMYGYTGPTANDEQENLMRPCSLQDWECIRKYFAANGKCKPAYGPIPDPMIFDVMTVYFSLANLTVSFPDGQIRGLSSAKVRDFFVNKKTGNLVFAFDIQDFNQTLPRAYFRYRRTAKESIILAGYATVNYQSATFTAVIPMVPDLRLDLADIHLDVQDGNPAFFISPEAAASPDPDVQAGLNEFLALRTLAIGEGVFFQAQLFASIYIQKNICDFGLKLSSV